MKLLIIPGNNSLSHGLKSILIQQNLNLYGHESLIAICADKAEFYKEYKASYHVIPDIQEVDCSAYPTINWFRDREHIIRCINAENSLIEKYKPDRVLGVFRFTLKAASSICNIPYDSLACGCMLPHISGALGFHNDADDPENNRAFINMFFRASGMKMNRALSMLGIKPVDDIRDMLVGERTFLWDFPEFMPLPEKKGFIHVGPLSWNKGKYKDMDLNLSANDSKPLAVMAFGTCNGNIAQMIRLKDILCKIGYKVIVAAGGQEKLYSLFKNDSDVNSYLFAPIDKILPHASLVVCHGGQMTIFEALANGVPVAVIPFHPEQAHNGICLERIGCGRMLTPVCRFVGNPSVYEDAFEKSCNDSIKAKIIDFVENPDTIKNLKRFKGILSGYNGIETLTAHLGQ
ncbi:MAG: glycosyl transferase [Deltaproteobacteria bacterium]|nr:glycosyl transferase [Deltaproteobacteria bacterium]